jgi:uncharacterized protein (TIGR02757 family)
LNFSEDFLRLKDFLEEKANFYNCSSFIENDPISIPHQFKLKQDREISGLWAAILAWGQRITIINKCRDLNDRKKFLSFKHRTFNTTDTLYFLEFFRQFYKKYDSLEEAFTSNWDPASENIEFGLINFHHLFFNTPYFPPRTKKHIATPSRNSACKRINMFLRWMVRKDENGVDFGIWNKIRPDQLVMPCDLHVDRVARKLGLISRKKTDWYAALELTRNLKKFDPKDPVKYDFALFGLGIDSV